MNLIEQLANRIVANAPLQSPYIVALCAWADTGKSTIAALLCAQLNAKGFEADWISTDAFLIDRSLRNSVGISGYNPQSIHADQLNVRCNAS